VWFQGGSREEEILRVVGLAERKGGRLNVESEEEKQVNREDANRISMIWIKSDIYPFRNGKVHSYTLCDPVNSHHVTILVPPIKTTPGSQPIMNQHQPSLCLRSLKRRSC
jgi:hypothetical protein